MIAFTIRPSTIHIFLVLITFLVSMRDVASANSALFKQGEWIDECNLKSKLGDPQSLHLAFLSRSVLGSECGQFIQIESTTKGAPSTVAIIMGQCTDSECRENSDAISLNDRAYRAVTNTTCDKGNSPRLETKWDFVSNAKQSPDAVKDSAYCISPCEAQKRVRFQLLDEKRDTLRSISFRDSFVALSFDSAKGYSFLLENVDQPTVQLKLIFDDGSERMDTVSVRVETCATPTSIYTVKKAEESSNSLHSEDEGEGSNVMVIVVIAVSGFLVLLESLTVVCHMRRKCSEKHRVRKLGY